MAYRAFEKTQTAESILASKDFSPIVEDFVHMELDFVPTEGSLDHKVDLVQGRIDISLP